MNIMLKYKYSIKVVNKVLFNNRLFLIAKNFILFFKYTYYYYNSNSPFIKAIAKVIIK